VSRKKKTRVFVSYSRHDEALVKPLAALLGAAARDAVFLDVNSIKPGDRWKQEIDSALQDAAVFILCWCCQSQASDFVGYEIRMAIEIVRSASYPFASVLVLCLICFQTGNGLICADASSMIAGIIFIWKRRQTSPLSWLRMFPSFRLKNRVLEEPRDFGGFDTGAALGLQS